MNSRTSVAALGSRGKLGFRVTGKLIGAGCDMRAIEIGNPGPTIFGKST